MIEATIPARLAVLIYNQQKNRQGDNGLKQTGKKQEKCREGEVNSDGIFAGPRGKIQTVK